MVEYGGQDGGQAHDPGPLDQAEGEQFTPAPTHLSHLRLRPVTSQPITMRVRLASSSTLHQTAGRSGNVIKRNTMLIRNGKKPGMAHTHKQEWEETRHGTHTHKKEGKKPGMAHTHTNRSGKKPGMVHTHTKRRGRNQAWHTHTQTGVGRNQAWHTHTQTGVGRNQAWHTHTNRSGKKPGMAYTHKQEGEETRHGTHTQTGVGRNQAWYTHTQKGGEETRHGTHTHKQEWEETRHGTHTHKQEWEETRHGTHTQTGVGRNQAWHTHTNRRGKKPGMAHTHKQECDFRSEAGNVEIIHTGYRPTQMNVEEMSLTATCQHYQYRINYPPSSSGQKKMVTR